ncbi:MAG: monovalent cation/H(+) antiporter subunit G [Anaerolineae bacterium]|nr:monovalent cation/H(+) antiporter subunit G [Anaerolineae bacterium]
MDTIREGLALVVVAIGSAFSVIGVLGILRLPDVYARLHAAGKVSVFGAALLALAVVLLAPGTLGRALILVALLVIAGPVVSHAIASAAYRMNVPIKHAVRNDLARVQGDNRSEEIQ